MAKLKASRSAQYLMTASFDFNFDDTMKDVTGVEKDFGLTNIVATTFEVINLPQGAVVVGGDLTVSTAFDTASYAVVVGDVDVPNRYLATADRKGVARTALVPTGFASDGQNIRVGITNADVCTTGKARLTIQYMVPGRANETVTS